MLRHAIAGLIFVLVCPFSVDLSGQETKPVILGQHDSLLAGIPGKDRLSLAEIKQWLAEAKNHLPLEFELPKGLDAGKANVFIPADNPITKAKIELGRQLYFDTRLSSDNSISCARLVTTRSKVLVPRLNLELVLAINKGIATLLSHTTDCLARRSFGMAGQPPWRNRPSVRLKIQSKWGTRTSSALPN